MVILHVTNHHLQGGLWGSRIRTYIDLIAWGTPASRSVRIVSRITRAIWMRGTGPRLANPRPPDDQRELLRCLCVGDVTDSVNLDERGIRHRIGDHVGDPTQYRMTLAA